VVLPISVHKNDDITFRSTRTCLDCRPIALTIRMMHNTSTRSLGQDGGLITRAVIHYNDLGFWILPTNRSNGRADSSGLVLSGHDDT